MPEILGQFPFRVFVVSFSITIYRVFVYRILPAINLTSIGITCIPLDINIPFYCVNIIIFENHGTLKIDDVFILKTIWALLLL